MANIYVRSGAAGAANGTTWADAFTTIQASLAAETNADTIWVADDHAETYTVAQTWTFPTSPGLRILVASDHTTAPPTALAAPRLATVTTTTNAIDLVMNGFAYIYGIQFNHGTVGAQCTVRMGDANNLNHGIVAEDCGFNAASTSGVSILRLGCLGTNVSTRTLIELIRPVIGHESNQSQAIDLRNGRIRIDGLTTTGTPTVSTTNGFFNLGGTSPAKFVPTALIENFDLSAADNLNSSGVISVAGVTDGSVIFRNGKLPASANLTVGSFPGASSSIVKFHNVDSSDTHIRFAQHAFEGNTVSDTGIYLNAEQADGSRFSYKMTGSNATLTTPMQSPEIALWNSTVGSAQTATIEIIRDNATALTDAQIWVELSYLGTSGTPLGTTVSDRVTNVLTTAADQATSTAVWTGVGGFTNTNEQKLTVSFTAQEAGYITARVFLAANTTVYVDPYITLS